MKNRHENAYLKKIHEFVEMDEKSINLQVMECHPKDYSKNIARISSENMDKLQISDGYVLELHAKRVSVSKCLKLSYLDDEQDIIRIDRCTRNNIGVSIGDVITVNKTKAVATNEIELKCHDPKIKKEYLNLENKDYGIYLESMPVVNGDVIPITSQNKKCFFEISKITPNNQASLITKNTIFKKIFFREDLSDEYFQKGTICFDNQEYEKALEYYEKSMIGNSEYEHIFYNKSLTLAKLEKFDDALNNIEKSILLKPDDIQNKILKIHILEELKDHERVIEYCNQTLKKYEENYDIRLSRAVAHHNLKNFETAIEQYDNLLHDDERLDVLQRKAQVLTSMEEYKRAIEVYDRILMFDENYAEAWKVKGEILEQMNREEESMECLQRFRELKKLDIMKKNE